MKTFELYANGPSADFNHIEDLKKNEIIKKRLFNEDGFVKKLHLSRDCPQDLKRLKIWQEYFDSLEKSK